MTTIPAFTIGGITRPELFLDPNGNIVLTPAAQAFAGQYGLKALYLGCPPGTPYPPVPGFSMPTPVDTNAAANIVAENAAVNTPVNITAEAHDIVGFPITYSLTADFSGGGFQINASTGVVTVANPHQIDFEASAGHGYSITVQANDGIFATSQSFTIGVSDVAPSAPTDANGAANTVAEGAANGTAVGVTANSTDVHGGTVTYSIAPGGDSSGGGFTVNATTGVVTVADATKIDFESAPGHAYTVTVQATDGTLSQLAELHHRRHRRARPRRRPTPMPPPTPWSKAPPTAPPSASPRPPPTSTAGRDLFADRRHLRRRLHHQCHDRRRHRRRRHQDRLRKLRRARYTVTAQASDGTLTSSQTFTIAVTDARVSTPVDTDDAANTVIEGAANGTTVGVTAFATDPNGPAVDLCADRRHLRRRLHHQFRDRRRHRRRFRQDRLRERSGPRLHRHRPGHRRRDHQFADVHHRRHRRRADSTPVDSNGAANTVVEGAANGSTVGVTASSTDLNGPAVTYSLIGDTSAAASPSMPRPASSPSPIPPRSTSRPRPDTPTPSPRRPATATAHQLAGLHHRRDRRRTLGAGRQRRRAPTPSTKAPPTVRPSASPRPRPTSTDRPSPTR